MNPLDPLDADKTVEAVESFTAFLFYIKTEIVSCTLIAMSGTSTLFEVSSAGQLVSKNTV